MTEEKKTSWRDLFISPPVIGAIITSTVAIMLFVIPRMLDDPTTSTPVPTTVVPPTEIREREPTEATPVPTTVVPPTEISEGEPTEATPVPTTVALAETEPTEVTPVPTATPTQTPAPPDNVLLLFDDVAFTLYNQSTGTLSLNDVRFQSASGRWDAVQWGAGLAAALPADNCLRTRDTTSGERQPPAICGNLYGFQLVGQTALFWLGVESFEVLNGDVVLATCSTASDTCPIYIEQ